LIKLNLISLRLLFKQLGGE